MATMMTATTTPLLGRLRRLYLLRAGGVVVVIMMVMLILMLIAGGTRRVPLDSLCRGRLSGRDVFSGNEQSGRSTVHVAMHSCICFSATSG